MTIKTETMTGGRHTAVLTATKFETPVDGDDYGFKATWDGELWDEMTCDSRSGALRLFKEYRRLALEDMASGDWA